MGMLLQTVLIRGTLPPPTLLREHLARSPRALCIWATPFAPAVEGGVDRDAAERAPHEGPKGQLLVPSTLPV